VKKIGVVTPYQPIFDSEVRNYFESMGFEVKSIVGLRCPSAVAIAQVTEAELRAALVEVCSSFTALAFIETDTK